LTGELEGDPLQMIADKFLTPPVKRMLAVGSGLAFKEESLVKRGYVEQLVVFEASEVAVESAKARIKADGLENKIEIRTGDVTAAGLERDSFDAVFIQAAIHHFYNIEEMFQLFHYVLKPGGQLLYDEYIGPDHHMYERQVFDLMDEINDCLDPSYKKDALRNNEVRDEVPQATLEWMLDMDPSEGVHSAEILPLTYKYFDVEFRNDYGGTFMRPFFVGILPNFNFDDVKDQTIARLIIQMEEWLLRYGVIPSYHTWVVGKKRETPIEKMESEDIPNINFSNWKGWEKFGSQSIAPKVRDYKAANFSDDNWTNGVGKLGVPVFFLPASRKAMIDFVVGNRVIFYDESERKIINVEQNEQSLIITLEGNQLDPNIVGFPNKIQVSYAV
jgi:SAM-dependent methyltransferase